MYDSADWSEIAHTEPVVEYRRFALAPDGSVMATVSVDGIVRVYDLETLELRQAIPIGGELTNLAFIGDTHLLVVPRTGPGFIVIVDVDELLTLAGTRVTRTFTSDESAAYRIDPCPAG